MTEEEKKLVRYFQIQFLKTYLCKPPLELLEIVLVYHRLAKSFEKIISNIQIQLSDSGSNLNLELQKQIYVLNNRMSNL